MLVLTRKLQQQIKIGEQITVTVLRVKGNTVRIGIQAPREVRVVRGELPKTAPEQETQTAESAMTEQVVMAVCDEPAETSDTNEEAAVIACCDSTQQTDESPATIRAPHLPLKRIRDRYGVAPLKQVIASCPTLAK